MVRQYTLMMYIAAVLTLTSAACAQVAPGGPPAGVATESRDKNGPYDFHYDVRYPGRLRSDTSYDHVTEQPGPLKEYSRRVVTWWPKRGLDVTPLQDIAGAPKRTWTPVLPDDTWSHTWLDNFPSKPFEAYLVGFRGVGDDALHDLNDPNSFWCPTPVLLLPDGRKRAILGKYLSPKDRRFVVDIYNKDRARIDKTLVQDEYKVAPHVLKKFPITGEAELHKDHEFVRFDSKHFSTVVPGKPPATGKSWVRKEDHKQVMEMIRFLQNQFEAYWAYHEYAGALVRYWEKDQLYKYKPTVFHGGGGGGGGYGGCTMGGTRPLILFHEWGHGMKQGGLAGLGGYEASADSLSIMGDPSNIKRAGQWIARPWKNLFHGAYRGGSGYEILADDPNWGYAVTPIISTLASDTDYTPMHVMAHLGVERGLWKKGQGIKGMGDLIGQIGARFAEFDCIQEFQFRGWFGSANRSCLVPIDTTKGIYRCPAGEAPEPFGVNISRLVAEPGAKKITIDFQGDYDPETYADWRACIVAVGSDFRCRYSPLWNKGKMSMDVRPGDKRYWLTVTATPKALLHTPTKHGAWVVYQGGFAYRYPYQVRLSGCTAGSAYASPEDNNNSKLAAPEWTQATVYGDLFEVPTIMTDAEKQQFRKEARSVLAYATKKKTAIEKEYAASDATAFVHERWGFRWSLDMLDALIERVGILTDNLDGAPHANGGGWVSSNAYAAPSAYVGKNCYVMDGARVLGNAILLDSAVVRGPGAVVKDHAKLSGKAAIIGDVVAGGYARVNHPIINQPAPWLADADRVVQTIDGTPRDGLFEKGLVANYGCLRPEAVLLEDLLINRSTTDFFNGGHMTKTPTRYDGTLVGEPGFDMANGSGALVFNGKDQYAELPPDAVDFGQLVLVLRIKPSRLGTTQTIFDFGSSLDNRFTLTLDASGTPTLSWQADKGKQTGKLVGKTPLKANRWATLRVGINGHQARLCLNDNERKSARTHTRFRPADVFVPGLGRQNFLFRNRDDAQPDYFAGQLDYLRVYSQAPPRFQDLPAMPTVSPTKAMSSILEYFQSAAPKKPKQEPQYQKPIHIALKNGWLHNRYTWNDRLQEQRSLFDWKPDNGGSAKMLQLRDRAYALEAEYLLRRFELKREFLAKNPKLKAAPRKHAAQKQPKANPKLAAIRSATEKRVRAENPEVTARIKSLRENIAARKDALATTVGPVAKAFAPVLKKYEAKLKTAKDPAAVKREIEELRHLRDSLLVRRVNDRVPPSGLWYLDEELRKLREQLAHAERSLASERDQTLLGNPEYQALKSQDRTPKSGGPTTSRLEYPAIPGFDEYLQQDAGLAALQKRAQQAVIDWYAASTMIMYSVVPPEYYFPNDMVLKNRKFTVASSAADPPYFHQFDHPSNVSGQLKTAVEWQSNWAETCDDWDTRQAFEKDYDTQTDLIKKWLQRVKPYRYK